MFSMFTCCKKKAKNLTKPPVHILIPLYNAQVYIVAALQSIFNQDYPNLKIFIYDDGSTDDSLNIVKDFFSTTALAAKKFKIHAEKSNRGVSHARTELINISRADNPYAYTLWLDADDQMLDKHFISKVIRQMLTTNADICLYNFSIQFEHLDQQNNAEVLKQDKENVKDILQSIHAQPNAVIDPIDMPTLMKFTSLGWTKCYAPTINLPIPAECPFEDFVYMAALLFANRITALAPNEQPILYLRRSTSICGQRSHENFATHIPLQLSEFFNVVLKEVDGQVQQLVKLKMAQQFVINKLSQYENMLVKFVEDKSFADISMHTMTSFLHQRVTLINVMNAQIDKLDASLIAQSPSLVFSH